MKPIYIRGHIVETYKELSRDIDEKIGRNKQNYVCYFIWSKIGTLIRFIF